MLRLLAILVSSCTLLASARADTVFLSTGGQVEGKVTQLDDRERSYRIELESGVEMTVARDQVNRVAFSTPGSEDYASRARSAPDTVEAQMAIAKWCRERKLIDEYRRHLRRIVELDPNHKEARALLEYRNVNGKWLTREQQMAERGLVFYDGRYRTRQDVALRMRKDAVTDEVSDWRSKLKRWRRWLDDRRAERVQEAVAEFDKLSDPMAAEPLVNLIEDERDAKVRALLLTSAAQIDHQATVNVLVVASVEDPNEEIRFQTLEAIVDSQRPGLVAPYAKLLKSPDNVVVNRAGVALGSIGDKSAIAPLIDALITEHKQVIGSASGGDTYSFSPTTGGFSFGGGGPQVNKFTRQNPDVLSALVRLSGGETFGYDQRRWRQWLATQVTSRHVNLRRTR